MNNQKFSGFITDPAAVTREDEKALAILLERFPYAQILHQLHVKCFDKSSAEFSEKLTKAALYSPDRNLLYKLVNDPLAFTEVEEPAYTPPAGSEEVRLTEHAADLSAEVAAIDVPEDDAELRPGVVDEYEEEIIPEIVIEQAGGAGIPATPVVNLSKAEVPAIDAVSEPEAAAENPEAAPEKRNDETEKLILGNIAATDYFRFEQKLDDQTGSPAPVDSAQAVEEIESQEEQAPMSEVPVEADESSATQEVSKYDDDKMPYTFLWWLSKTRKEHAGTYQPFKLDTGEDIKKNSGEELNHQIIENIFHLQSPLEQLEQERSKTVSFQLKRKEEEIIEKFIKEEPQIKPPRPEKLDTENKARRSSEDTNDLVSETLAQIYIEQMLFHKAIDTYKKLSLKFPEKSTYFADQIRKLENR